ncbi:MAG TPA: hypothetical protein DEP20_00180 [Fusobacteria bacterium]|nr:hypothetical protein [Fusobacteriota bacterium]|tara:strand:+ start:6330 stop:6569 length:240 start_codon:yes stop_codon:yes gene_type:complete
MSKNLDLSKASGGYKEKGGYETTETTYLKTYKEAEIPISISGKTYGKIAVAEGVGNKNLKAEELLPSYLANAVKGKYDN